MGQQEAHGITRRSFIQKSGAAGSTALLTSMAGALPTAAQGASVQPPDETIDVAIVGAGVAGVYCAWRLLQDDPSRTVTVFDAADHVGGRLLSVQPPGIDDMVAELGGMRILPAVQPRIAGLVDELNDLLTADTQIELYDFPVDEPQNLAYLRGVHLRLSDLTTEPDKVPYQLSFLEEGRGVASILIDAIDQIVPGMADPSLNNEQRRQIAQNASFAGLPLYEQGFWNVLARVMSSEAYQLGVDVGGYNSTVINWNAADAIPWFLADFGIAPQYKGFKQGFQSVPLALADQVRQLGGEVRLNTPLLGFDYVDGAFKLQLPDIVVQSASLILAMPRRSLDLLAPSSPPLQEFPDLIASVTPQPLFKIFTTYDDPWWRAAGYTTSDGDYLPLQSGRSVTDLPLQQIYYWPQNDGSAATDGAAMLMASYLDGAHVGFWDGLRAQRGDEKRTGLSPAQRALLFRGQCDASANPRWCANAAPQKMVDEVSRQLALVHDLSYVPDVQDAAYRDWGDDPFGGGWNAWKIGVKSWEVIDRITQPLDDRALFVCGEAYSNWQGWVEGALETADIVLEKFGMTSNESLVRRLADG